MGSGGGAAGRAALDHFCAAEYPRLVGALTLYCGDRHIAEVLAQDTLVKVCDRWSAVAVMDAPGAWAHRVAINAANSWFTRRSAERRALSRSPRARDHHDDPDVADSVAIRDAVASLPTRRRAALVLRYFADLSVEQTAVAMRCRPATVRALTFQAIQQLRATADLLPAEEEFSNGQ